MNVVSDTNALVWYTMLNTERLSKRADRALQEAEATDGVVVSVATLVDLWYVTQTSKASTKTPFEGFGTLSTTRSAASGLSRSPST